MKPPHTPAGVGLSVSDSVGAVAGAVDLAALGRTAQRIRLRVQNQATLVNLFGELFMALNDDITQDLASLTTAVQGLATAYVASNKTIADLQAQLAAGPPGLTADQGQAILTQLVATQKIASDALATAGVAAPAPVVTP